MKLNKKNKQNILLLASLIVVLVIAGIIILGNNKEKPKPIDKTSSDQISSSQVAPDPATKKGELEKLLLDFAKKEYDKIELEKDAVVILNLADLKEVYDVNIDKYLGNDYNCDKSNTYVKIDNKANKKTYSVVLSCQNIE